MSTNLPLRHDLRWIQALRGVAALLVLFFHMLPHWELDPVLGVTSVITRWGFSGVDIFFALSGFVVYRSARNSVPARGLWPFIRKRLLRIYLGYWPVLLVIALTTVFIYEDPLPDVKKMVFSTLLLYPHIWDNWLPPAWSLSMEIYFYLWIALITLMPARFQIKAICAVMLVLAAWGVGWLLIDRPSVYEGSQPLRYGLTGLGLEFLAGALIAHVYDRKLRLFHTPALTMTVCVVLASAGLALGTTSIYFDRVEVMRASSFGVMGLCALIFALTLEQTRWDPPRWLVAVGDASYSLYLLHTFLLDASSHLRKPLVASTPEALVYFLIALPLAIVLISLLWYRWVEKPIMKVAL